MYVFGFGDKLSQSAFYYMLESYEPTRITFFDFADDPAKYYASHQAIFNNVLKGATLVVTIQDGKNIEIIPKDPHMKMGHYIGVYSNINTNEVRDWLNQRATQKSGDPVKQISAEHEKIYPALKGQQDKRRAEAKKAQEERSKQLEAEQAERKIAEIEKEKQHLISLKEQSKTNSITQDFYANKYGETIKKDYPELYDEYQQGLQEIADSKERDRWTNIYVWAGLILFVIACS
jgi:hypothetical protein